jgi:hypothetical protein
MRSGDPVVAGGGGRQRPRKARGRGDVPSGRSPAVWPASGHADFAGEELARWPQHRLPGCLPGQSGEIGNLGLHPARRSSAIIDA